MKTVSKESLLTSSFTLTLLVMSLGSLKASEIIFDDSDEIDTICSKSKVSYDKCTFRHNWRISGMLDMVNYLNKFNTAFEVQSDNVKFKSPKFDGKWTFKLAKEKNQPLVLTATYKYETATADALPLTFDMSVTVFVEDVSIELPAQISAFGELTGQRQDYRPGVSYQYVFDFVHKFKWTDFASQTKQLMDPGPLGFGSQDVDLQFFITGYIPKDAETLNCQTSFSNSIPVLINSGSLNMSGPSHSLEESNEISSSPPSSRAKRYNPPFLSHMGEAMTKREYTDLTIKIGDDEFQVHKVILANSSPVLASMIFNLTFDHNESVLDLGEQFGMDVMEEVIRYIYTGRVDTIEEVAVELVAAAERYELPNLKILCESVLTQQVSVDNAIQMYSLANKVKSTRLMKRAFSVMKANKGRIASQSEEFRKLSVYYPNLMFELYLS